MKKYNTIAFGILAGGNSSRMGKDKSQLIYRGNTLIKQSVELLKYFTDKEILLSINKLPEYYHDSKQIKDIFQNTGPMGGIHALLKHIHTSKLLVIPVDMPLLNRQVIEYLLNHCPADVDICTFSTTEQVYMLPGIYDKRLLPAIEQLLKESKYKLKGLLEENYKYHLLNVGSYINNLTNVNTFDQWNAIRKA